jgi:subtilase family serine protease
LLPRGTQSLLPEMKKGWWDKSLFWKLLTIILMATGACQSQASPRTLLPGHVPALVFSLQRTGTVDPSTHLKLSIALPLHNQSGLQRLVDKVSDPQSPEYRHYLTPDQFSARYVATENDYATVIAWATRNGFAIPGRQRRLGLIDGEF